MIQYACRIKIRNEKRRAAICAQNCNPKYQNDLKLHRALQTLPDVVLQRKKLAISSCSLLSEKRSNALNNARGNLPNFIRFIMKYSSGKL